MKKLIRRAVGAALSLAMLVGMLAGCGSSSYDPVKEIMGYDGSTVFFTVNGNKVTAMDYMFWMAKSADEIASYYTAMGAAQGEIDWSQPMGGSEPMGDYVKTQAKNMAVLYNVVEAKAKETGYAFSKEDKAEYEKTLEQSKAELGSEEAYTNWLKSMCVNDKAFLKLSTVGVLYSHMTDGMCREGGEYAPTAEELTQYATDKDLLCAKHILLSTKDTATGADLTDAQKAEKKTKAEALLKELQAITDAAQLEAKFDELMKANSEDPGLSTNADGYIFTTGEMVEAFETATKALEPGKLSGLVESDYGYHIILRLNPANSKAMQERWANEKMNSLLDEWVSKAEESFTTTEEYDNLTTEDFYTKLLAYRATLQPKEDAQKPEGETSTEPTEGTEEPAAGGDTPASNAEDKTTDGKNTAEDGDAPTSNKSDEGKTTDSTKDSANTADSEKAAE